MGFANFKKGTLAAYNEAAASYADYIYACTDQNVVFAFGQRIDGVPQAAVDKLEDWDGSVQAAVQEIAGQSGGLATLGTDGKVPAAQLPELDLSLYKVVDSLPASGADENKIYLVLSGAQGEKNLYTEYAFVEGQWEKLGEYAAEVDLTNYVKFTDTATTAKAGAMSAQDKLFLEGIQAGNMQLPTPAITGAWTYYKNDGTTEAQPSEAGAAGNAASPVLEEGWKARFVGTYSWTHQSGKKDPTQVASNSSWTDLPASGAASSEHDTGVVGANTTVRAAIQAAKTGLMVSGSDVKPATGMDTAQATRSVTFTTRRYAGCVATATPSESNIKQLPSDLGGKSVTKTGVTASGSEYYVFAYPKRLGALAAIIQDGATPVLSAFTRQELTVTNDAGYEVPLYVYVSNNPGAFTNAKLQFS